MLLAGPRTRRGRDRGPLPALTRRTAIASWFVGDEITLMQATLGLHEIFQLNQSSCRCFSQKQLCPAALRYKYLCFAHFQSSLVMNYIFYITCL